MVIQDITIKGLGPDFAVIWSDSSAVGLLKGKSEAIKLYSMRRISNGTSLFPYALERAFDLGIQTSPFPLFPQQTMFHTDLGLSLLAAVRIDPID